MTTFLGTQGDPRLRTVSEQRIVEMLLLGGWAYEVRDGGRAEAAEETCATLARWVAGGLPVGHDGDGGRCYDVAEVLNFMKWVALTEGDAFWLNRYVGTLRRCFADLNGSGPTPGAVVEALPPRRFAFHLHRTFPVAAIAPGTTLRLNAPVPLDGPWQQRLALQITSAADGARLRVLPSQVEARVETPRHGGEAHLSYATQIMAWPQGDSRSGRPPVLEDAARALYTQPREGLIDVSSRIVDLAARLAGDQATPEGCLSAFWAYIMGHLKLGAIHYQEIDPHHPTDWALNNGWVDCQLASAVMIALCRACGIPARMICGYQLYTVAPGFHYWMEAWLEGTGWRPYDSLAWDLSGGGTDPLWRDVFAGRTDYHLVTQVFPRLVTGPMSLRLPRCWHMPTAPIPGGLRRSFVDALTAETLFSEEIRVQPDPPEPADAA